MIGIYMYCEDLIEVMGLLSKFGRVLWDKGIDPQRTHHRDSAGRDEAGGDPEHMDREVPGSARITSQPLEAGLREYQGPA